jgi:hypothetical protein
MDNGPTTARLASAHDDVPTLPSADPNFRALGFVRNRTGKQQHRVLGFPWTSGEAFAPPCNAGPVRQGMQQHPMVWAPCTSGEAIAPPCNAGPARQGKQQHAMLWAPCTRKPRKT